MDNVPRFEEASMLVPKRQEENFNAGSAQEAPSPLCEF